MKKTFLILCFSLFIFTLNSSFSYEYPEETGDEYWDDMHPILDYEEPIEGEEYGMVSDDSEKIDGCPCKNGGYVTTGTQKESNKTYVQRVKIRFKSSGLVQLVNPESLGTIKSDYEVIGDVVTLVTVAYHCEKNSKEKCCYCFRYVLSDKGGDQ